MCIKTDLVISMLEHAADCLRQAKGACDQGLHPGYAEWKAVEAVHAIDWVCEHMKGVKLEDGSIDIDALRHSI